MDTRRPNILLPAQRSADRGKRLSRRAVIHNFLPPLDETHETISRNLCLIITPHHSWLPDNRLIVESTQPNIS